MSKINWDSYLEPPDEEYPCEICGEHPDNCICPECHICGEIGYKRCYVNHGMTRTEEQKFSLECANRKWELETLREMEYFRLADMEDL